MHTSSNRRPRLACRWALGAALLTAQAVDVQALRADNFTVTGQRYHAQVTDHYCASATIQMMLDCTAVRTTNPYINTFLMAPEAPFIPPARHVVPGAPIPEQIPQQPIYNAGQVTFSPQGAIYNLIHGQATFTPTAGPNAGVPLFYNNPNSPWPSAGSGNNAIQWALNVYDNPNAGGFGNHAYVAYNVPPTPAWGDWASRTIANAIKSFDVAAQVTIGSGAHAIAVTGYTTNGTPGRNQAYDITGFYVNDPWTGYADSQNIGVKGLGVHAWVKYGWSRNPVKPLVNVPGVGLVNAAPSEWFRNFNPAPGQAGEGAYMSGLGYKFVVEPLGPEALDDGNGGLLESVPALAPLLPMQLDAPGALAAASAAITSGDLQNLYGLSGGAFDSANMLMIDPLDEADWFVPYVRAGEYTGAVLVSSYTGEIQQASWLEAADDVDFSLVELSQMYQDIYADISPGGNPPFVPEPGTLALVLLAWPALRRRRAA